MRKRPRITCKTSIRPINVVAPSTINAPAPTTNVVVIVNIGAAGDIINSTSIASYYKTLGKEVFWYTRKRYVELVDNREIIDRVYFIDDLVSDALKKELSALTLYNPAHYTKLVLPVISERHPGALVIPTAAYMATNVKPPKTHQDGSQNILDWVVNAAKLPDDFTFAASNMLIRPSHELEARNFLQKIDHDKLKVLVEYEYTSLQSFANVESFKRICAATSRPAVFIFSGLTAPTFLRELIRLYPLHSFLHYSGSFMSNAALYNACDVFVGVSSGISALTMSSYCNAGKLRLELVIGPYWSSIRCAHLQNRFILYSNEQLSVFLERDEIRNTISTCRRDKAVSSLLNQLEKNLDELQERVDSTDVDTMFIEYGGFGDAIHSRLMIQQYKKEHPTENVIWICNHKVADIYREEEDVLAHHVINADLRDPRDQNCRDFVNDAHEVIIRKLGRHGKIYDISKFVVDAHVKGGLKLFNDPFYALINTKRDLTVRHTLKHSGRLSDMRFADKLIDNKWVLFEPFSASFSHLTNLPAYQKLANALDKAGIPVVVVGSFADLKLTGVIDYTDSSFYDVVTLIKNCTCFVGRNSANQMLSVFREKPVEIFELDTAVLPLLSFEACGYLPLESHVRQFNTRKDQNIAEQIIEFVRR